MSEITDEFKIIVVDAIRSLCLKFPAKQAVMLSFLSGVLRDEGGYDFKRAVVEAIFDMIKYISDCKETGKSTFAYYIITRIQLIQVLYCSAGTPLRIHRGLRIHKVICPDPAFARTGRTQDQAAYQVHPVYL